MSERFEKGRAVTDAMIGSEFGAAIERTAKSGLFGADAARLGMEHAFGDVWSRPGLDRKLRSVATIAVLIATRQIEELKLHTDIGIANGLSVTELEELLLQCQPYLGWPALGTASRAVEEVLEKRGLLKR